MMHRSTWAIAALSVLALSGPAWAQGTPAAEPQKRISPVSAQPASPSEIALQDPEIPGVTFAIPRTINAADGPHVRIITSGPVALPDPFPSNSQVFPEGSPLLPAGVTIIRGRDTSPDEPRKLVYFAQEIQGKVNFNHVIHVPTQPVSP